MIESLLLATTRISAMHGDKNLSNATGFFFERDKRLFLVTNRHVVLNEATNHCPDHLEIELHIDPENVATTSKFLIPLYQQNTPLWCQATDVAGIIDVVVLELQRDALPKTVFLHAFSPAHLLEKLDEVEVGTPVIIVGFPLGFHDTLHHLPVARQAVVASAFGIRFQGNGYFLTAGRMHRGTSGAPVVVRTTTLSGRGKLAWALVGIHASRLDVTNRDDQEDERLDLNCTWYADILRTLTDKVAATPASL
jgi:trypsin-like peptidase